MWHFTVPNWILSYKMTSNAKLILMRAFNLCGDSDTPRYLTNKDLSEMFGISEGTVGNAFAELEREGFVTTFRNPQNKWDGKRFFKLTPKALMSDEDIQHIDLSENTNFTDSNKQNLNYVDTNFVDSQNTKIALSSSKNIDKRKNKRERALCSIISLSGLIKLFNDTAKVMSNEHPLAQNLNLKHVAEKFYTIKASATFATDEALNSAVTKWLLDEIEYEMNSGKKSSASNQVDAFTAMERFSQFINSRNDKSITTGTDYALKSITKKE